MKTLVTGGAGFIGGHLIRQLNKEDLIVSDSIYEHKDRLSRLSDYECIDKDELLEKIGDFELAYVIHLGAENDSTETNLNYLLRVNTNYTRFLWTYCTEKKIPFIYASSSATYGDGSLGFSDDHALVPRLHPVSAYAISKHLFDVWALRQQKTSPHWYGLKFFNVYGADEGIKGKTASMIHQMIQQIKHDGCVSLFGDGQQARDFIHVDDVVRIIQHFQTLLPESGIYNVGTADPQTYNQIARWIFEAFNISPDIRYEEMPKQFQRFTKANITKLRRTGFSDRLISCEEGIRRTIDDYYPNSITN